MHSLAAIRSETAWVRQQISLKLEQGGNLAVTLTLCCDINLERTGYHIGFREAPAALSMVYLPIFLCCCIDSRQK